MFRTALWTKSNFTFRNKCLSTFLVPPCRNYTSKNSLLNEINLKMFNVLERASVRNHSGQFTLQSILKVAEELDPNGESFDSQTYEYLLSAYNKMDSDLSSRSTELDHSLALEQEMIAKGIKPSRTFYHKALQHNALFGDSATQAILLNSMEKFSYKPTSKTYHLMLLCMRESAELERALDTFLLMKLQNIKPGLLSYLCLIDLAVTLNQPDIASEFLEEAEKLETFRVKDRIHSMHILRSASNKGLYEITKTNWRKAVGEYGFKPDEGVCLNVLNLAGKHGDPTLAADVIRLLGEEGYTYRECHFVPLIESFASTGDIASTFQVFTAMRKVNVIPNRKTALPIVYQIGSDVNMIRNAAEVLEKLAKTEGEAVDVVAFNLIIHAFAFNKQYDEAISIFGRAKEFGVKPNTETLDAALDACIHCKDAELGEMIYKEQRSRGMKLTASTYSKMVTLLCTQPDYEGAFKYLEKMKQLNLVPLRGCYFKLVKTLSAANDPRLDLAIEDMKACGYDISPHLEDYMLNEEQLRLQAEIENTGYTIMEDLKSTV